MASLLAMHFIPNDPYGVLGSIIYHESHFPNLEGLFRLMGVVHLYRSSGIHFFTFFMGLDFLILWTGRKLRIRAKTAHLCSLLGIGICGFSIWKLQGFPISVVRPLLGFLLRKWFRERGVTAKTLFPLSLTLFLEWIITRDQGFSPGAMHYYFAVAGSLIALDTHQNESTGRLHLRMALYSWIPGAMIDLIRDHLISFMTPIFSLLSIPIISFILYPLTLLSVLLKGAISEPLIRVWGLFLKGLIWIIDVTPHFALTSSRSIVLAFLLTLLIQILKNRLTQVRNLKSGMISGIVLLILFRVGWPTSTHHQVVQWNVGQGDAALVQSDRRNELVDVGPARGQSVETWIRRLSRDGVQQLDSVLLTHLDLDHRGGLSRILPVVKVSCLEIYSRQQKEPRGLDLLKWIHHEFPETEVRGEGCIQGMRVAWFQSQRRGSAGNEWMAGVYYELDHEKAYFALGDGDQSQELQFGKTFQSFILNHPKRIWKVGHHGSKFSSDPEFLKWLHPEQLWISVGAKNPYHHPSLETLARLSTLPGQIQRTDESGDLSATSSE